MLCIMKKNLALFCLSILLSACYVSDNGRGKCIHSPQSVYCFGESDAWENAYNNLIKENISTQENKQDIKECIKKTRQDINGYVAFVHCMKEKGYQEIKK